MKYLFVKVSIPSHHRQNPIANSGAWYCWSPASIRLIADNLERIDALSHPWAISVPGCKPYASTYRSTLSKPLVTFALEAAAALLRIKIGSQLKFFAGMLNPPLTSQTLEKSFALIRAGVAKLTGDPRTALHSPVKTELVDGGLALHSDLFLPDRLWVVFDDVPEGPSGEALFLPRQLLDSAIRRNRLMPSNKKRRLQALLSGKIAGDNFNECYGLLHSVQNPWTASLSQVMKHQCSPIKFEKGEGYLIDDRRWLHGRTPVKGGVSEYRFQRLVFSRAIRSQSLGRIAERNGRITLQSPDTACC